MSNFMRTAEFPMDASTKRSNSSRQLDPHMTVSKQSYR